MTVRRSRHAALLDRDGTIIVDSDYTRDPDAVVLLPGAAAAVRTLASAGYPVIVFTNQSGIARGLVTLDEYNAVRSRFEDLLAAEGATVIDTFTCPHHPDFTGPCECRKPGSAMYERAAVLHELDLTQCLFIGDRYRDIAVGQNNNARSAMVLSTRTSDEDRAWATQNNISQVSSLHEAVTLLLNTES